MPAPIDVQKIIAWLIDGVPGATSPPQVVARLGPELVAGGVTDYYATPLTFISGQIHAITFATRHPEGFSEEQIAALTSILAPLSRIAEIFALSRTAENLLNTYIGGAGRLDFTCIGQAVNLASRLEGLTGKLGRDVVLSQDFARLTTRAVESLGPFDLKGVADPEEVFAPKSAPSAR